MRKTILKVDDYERNLLIRALNDLRTALLAEGRSTDAVDELMIRIYESGSRELRVAEERSGHEYR